ncbi:single-stranded DNA-binding protein [Gordonia sp. (in: high G+C Gram-positive bacteria)]|uniref:single-stranded DNA-binding protein n=1 Tax=Gordonia sp. (in: high G+C Gram-positive bacteria) TaxID=84139 RepID=UPI0039E67F37
MFETPMTVVGQVITDPIVRKTAGGDVVSFRVASNSRRLNSETGEWEDDKTLYLSVSCWRKLALGVAASVAKGRPIIVHGNVRTSEYTVGDERRSSLEMTAKAVGLDLSRCIVKFCGFPNDPVPAADTESEGQDQASTDSAERPAAEVTDVDDEIAGTADREEAPVF